MIATDTNVLVRLVVNDDPAQTRRAAALFAEASVFVSKTVLLETVSVLESAYELERTNVLVALRSLFGLSNLIVEGDRKIFTALDWYEQGMDFADALHISSVPDDARFYSFDVKLHKKATALKLKQVVKA
ncbi:MAG: type II toxin-antitoxin system VapC family toxin [Gammaproteobacteria bacterium]